MDLNELQSLPLPMRLTLTEQGVPNLLSQEEGAFINLNVGDEKTQPVMSAQEAGVQVGDQVGPESMPLPVDPYEGPNQPVVMAAAKDDPGDMSTVPQTRTDKIDVPQGGLGKVGNQILDEIRNLPAEQFERKKELLDILGKLVYERDVLQARTRENIAKYEANARREAEIAKALTFVAYKANRPDAELIGQLMSPMSGTSSLYQSRGAISPSNIQTGRVK